MILKGSIFEFHFIFSRNCILGLVPVYLQSCTSPFVSSLFALLQNAEGP